MGNMSTEPMATREFKPTDLDTINAWLIKRGLPITGLEVLPSVGVINSCSAGFLIQASQHSAFFDCLFTNPDASEAERQAGAQRVIDSLIAKARSMGIKCVQFYTSIYSEKYGHYIAQCVQTHEQVETCKRWIAVL